MVQFPWTLLLPGDHQSLQSPLAKLPEVAQPPCSFSYIVCSFQNLSTPASSSRICPQSPPPSVAYVGQHACNGRVWILHAMCIANIPQDLCHESLWKWQMVGKRAKKGSKNKSSYDLTKGGPVPVPTGSRDILGDMDSTREKESAIWISL